MHLPHSVCGDIDKVFRYGRSLQGRPQPVIVRFTKISTRDLVFSNVKYLHEARSRVYVNEDLPLEVKNQRADLRAIVTHAKHLNIDARIKGDILTLKNHKYRHEDLDLLPTHLHLPAARTPQVADNVVGFYSRHSPLSNSVLELLIKLQKKAVRLVFNKNQRTHSLPLFIKAEILPLDEIYTLTVASYMFKRHHNVLPDIITNGHYVPAGTSSSLHYYTCSIFQVDK